MKRHHPVTRLFRFGGLQSLLLTFVSSLVIPDAEARSFRTSSTFLPNGTVFNCLNCHRSAGGGGTRNAFGQAVNALVSPNGSQRFWSPALAALDSDGDGFTNGEELGDPDGDGIPIRGAVVTNPGDPNSKPDPVNLPPTITGMSPAEAVIGLFFETSVNASDPENQNLTFSLLSGPDWLVINPTSGVLSGIPTDGSAGASTIQVEVKDPGDEKATVSFELKVRASFSGWRAARFNLPEEDSIADMNADPDGDLIPNVLEYALNLDPKSADPSPYDGLTRENGTWSLVLQVRQDDPDLEYIAEFSDSVEFPVGNQTLSKSVKPVGGSGMTSITLADELDLSEAPARFLRLGVRL